MSLPLPSEAFTLGSSVAHELIDGELVAINLDSGSYFSVRGSGPAIWSALLAGHSPAAVAAALVARFPAAGHAIADDIRSFVALLVSEGLLVTAPGVVPGGDVGTDELNEYASPQLEKFDDLADMFMLDPIHDVTEAGWPNVAAAR